METGEHASTTKELVTETYNKNGAVLKHGHAGNDVGRMERKGQSSSCQFWLIQKRRHCRMHRLAGEKFCAEHVATVAVPSSVVVGTGQEPDDNTVGSVLHRINCPFDTKHTVALSRLKAHLKKCNSKPPVEKDYYKLSANSNYAKRKKTDEEDEGDELNILSMNQDDKIRIIIALINFHQEHVPQISNYFGIHDYLMGDFVRTDVGGSALRHLTQIGSLAKILEDHGLLKNSTCFIEFGSGRGGLTYGLTRVVKEKGLKNCKFILVDRTSPRYKKDNLVKTEEFSDVAIERIKISIEDLVVDKLPEISKYENIVGITKHLCGSGTDVALRSLTETTSNSERSKVRGFVFATCCHHRIEYADFVGNQYLPEEFSNGNFRALRQIAGWATNGNYKSSYIKDYFSVNEGTLKFLIDAEEKYPEIRLNKTIGRLVKEIMDHCRARQISESCADLNVSCKLVNYVDIETTRENLAIVAYPTT